jgi:Ca-activated chloride channel family protein
LRLGSLSRVSKLEILLEFMVAPISAGADEIVLAEGRFSLDIPSSPVPTSTKRINLRLPVVDLAETIDPPAEILQAMKQLTLYRMQERAQQDIADGDYTSAHRRLQHLATHLLSQGEHELARTVLNEAESLIKHQSLSEAGGKQIKYGTRALIPPSNSSDLY